MLFTQKGAATRLYAEDLREVLDHRLNAARHKQHRKGFGDAGFLYFSLLLQCCAFLQPLLAWKAKHPPCVQCHGTTLDPKFLHMIWVASNMNTVLSNGNLWDKFSLWDATELPIKRSKNQGEEVLALLPSPLTGDAGTLRRYLSCLPLFTSTHQIAGNYNKRKPRHNLLKPS